LYASQPHAFATLAADIAGALNLPAGGFSLDHDLTPEVGSGVSGLREASTINQAIGVLIDRGAPLEDSHRDTMLQGASSPVARLIGHLRSTNSPSA
jgi:hypothetical protein